MTAAEALQEVALKRRAAVETEDQRRAVLEYEKRTRGKG